MFNGSPVDEFKGGKKMGYQYAAPLPDSIIAGVAGVRLSFGISVSDVLGVTDVIQVDLDYRVSPCGAVFGAWRTSSVLLINTHVTVNKVYRLELRVPSDDVSGMDRGVLEVGFFRKGSGADTFPGNMHVHWILNYEDDTPSDDTPSWFLCGVAI